MENNSKAERLAGIIGSLDSLLSDSIGDLKGANEDFIKEGIKQAREQFKDIPNVEEAIKNFEKQRK